MILAILTFDLCSIICHTHWALCTGISMRICIRIGQVLMGDMPRTQTNKHKHTETHTKCKINSLIARLNIRCAILQRLCVFINRYLAAFAAGALAYMCSTGMCRSKDPPFLSDPCLRAPFFFKPDPCLRPPFLPDPSLRPLFFVVRVNPH